MASHHTRAFDYESISDQQEEIEMWRGLALAGGIIILAIFCPPAAAVGGVVLAGAEMYSAASGKDWGTGRQLSDGERVLRGSFALFDLIPGVGYLTKVAKTGSTTAAKGIIKQSLKEGFEQGARNVDNGLKLVTKFGDNVLSKVDDFGQQADQLFTKFSAKGADYLSTGLKNMDDGVSQAARNFRHNMGMEPQLVSGAMPSGNSTVNNLANKLDDFSKAQHLKMASSSVDEVGSAIKSGAKVGDDVAASKLSKNIPKIEYQSGISPDEILELPKGSRPEPAEVYTTKYIDAHKKQFDNGAIKIQRFTPEEGGFNNGAIGNPKDHVAFVMPKDVGETVIDASKNDPRKIEEILGLHPGDLGDNPVVVDIPTESINNLQIPSGNEDSAFDGMWRPGGRTYPGDIPEAVIDEVPWGKYSFRHLGGK